MKARYMSRHRRALLTLTAFVAILLAARPGSAAACDPKDFVNKTVQEYYDCVFSAQLDGGMIEAVENANVATPPADGFASRIHSSYQDFLKLLSFAVESVEESRDGRAFTVRLNPVRRGKNLVSVSVTAAKPEISDDIKMSIPEATRAEVVGKLEETLSDTDDVTLAVSYSRQSVKCDVHQLSTSRCWGRSPRIYRQAVSGVLAALGPGIDLDSGGATELGGLTSKNGNIFGMKLGEVFAEENRGKAIAILKQLAEEDAASTLLEAERLKESGIDVLATLIDNQPQLAATASYHDLGPLVGPREEAISLEFQYGGTNLNSTYKAAKGDPAAVLERLKQYQDEGFPTDKFVFSASYRRHDSDTLAALPLDEPVAGFTPVEIKKFSELKVRGQWGRQIGDYSVIGLGVPRDVPGPERARWDFTFEGFRTKLGKETENRWVAALTLTMPMTKQFSMPLTVNYANKSEFLADSRKRLSAHIGITYKLPWEPSKAD